jgi:hypothetical protein
MDTLLSNLVKLQDMLGQVLNASSGTTLTKSGKPRKSSDRKGKTTARSDFGKMICKEKAVEFEAFKATLTTKRAAHITFASNYKEQHPEVYSAFEAKWQAEHAEQKQVTLDTPVPAASAVPVATTEPPKKKPVKTAKKAITTEVVAPIEGSVPDELLPFNMGDKTFLRLGTRRDNGNHLWTSGHLWMSKKGAKGSHYGELREDGTINMDVEEPTC